MLSYCCVAEVDPPTDEEVGGRGSLKIRREEDGLVDFPDCCVSSGAGISSTNVAGRDDADFEVTDSLVAVVFVDAICLWHSWNTPA